MNKKTALLAIFLCLALCCVFVACDGDPEDPQEGPQKIELPQFEGEKTDFDKVGILEELGKQEIDQTIADEIKNTVEAADEINAFVSSDSVAVESYEQSLKDKGFVFMGEYSTDGTLAKLYSYTVKQEGEDSNVYITQAVFVVVSGDSYYVLYYEDSYTEPVYQLPTAEELARFDIAGLPDKGEGKVVYCGVDEYNPFGLVPSLEFRFLTDEEDWFDRAVQAMTNSGYIVDVDETPDPSYRSVSLIKEEGKNLFVADMHFQDDSADEQHEGKSYYVEMRVFDRVKESEITTGKTIWSAYEQATYTYERVGTSVTYPDPDNAETSEYRYVTNVRFNDRFMIFEERLDNKEPNAEYYDIAAKQAYWIVNYGHNREADNNDPGSAFQCFFWHDDLANYGVQVVNKKQTGNTRELDGITLYEYSGEYVNGEEEDAVVTPATVWQDENGIVFGVQMRTIHDDGSTDDFSIQITSFSASCDDVNEYASLPEAYAPVALPYDEMREYYGVAPDAVDGADGYYIVYMEQYDWDNDGNEIRELVPQLFALGVSESEFAAYKAMLSQKYTQRSDNSWEIALSVEDTLVLSLDYQYFQGERMELCFSYAREHYDLPEAIGSEASVMMKYSFVDIWGETREFIFVREGNTMFLYDRAEFSENERYDLMFGIERIDTNEYEYFDGYRTETRILTAKQVASELAQYGEFGFAIDGMQDAGPAVVNGVDVRIYEIVEGEQVYARFAYSEEYGVVVRAERNLHGDGIMTVMQAQSVGQFDRAFAGTEVLPDGEGLLRSVSYGTSDGTVREWIFPAASADALDAYRNKLVDNGKHIFFTSDISVYATDREYYLVEAFHYGDELVVTEKLSDVPLTEIWGTEIYRTGTKDLTVLGEGIYTVTVQRTTDGQEEPVSVDEIIYTEGGVYSQGNWTVSRDDGTVTITGNESVGTLSLYSAVTNDGTLKDHLNAIMGEFSSGYDFAAMLQAGLVFEGTDTVDGKVCKTYTYSVDGVASKIFWVDEQSGFTVKYYQRNVDSDKGIVEEYTYSFAFSASANLPTVPDFSGMAIAGVEYAASEWEDSYRVSPSVPQATGFDSFVLSVYAGMAELIFYGDDVALAVDPMTVSGYELIEESLFNTEFGESSIRVYNFDNGEGEVFTLRVEDGYGEFGERRLIMAVQLK